MKSVTYPATMHYEWHPTKKNVYAIHVQFPDLLKISLPASTAGNSPDDAIVAAKEILEMLVEFAEDEGISLPEPTPIEKVSIDREFDDISEPFKIVVEYISIGNE